MSTRHIEIRLTAQADLAERYDWLTQEAGTDIAEAMLLAASSAFATLAAAPGLGTPVETDQSELIGLRKWRVPAFDRLRVFYLTTDDALFVVRILHTAQNWPAELGRG